MKQKESWCGMQGWDSLTRAGSAPGGAQGGTGAACAPHKCWVLLFVGGMMAHRKPSGNAWINANWSGVMGEPTREWIPDWGSHKERAETCHS